MMTQPIQMFENLTSETSPAGGNDIAKTPLTFEERRILELRARYARAEMVAEREPSGKHDQAKTVESALRGQQTLQVHGLYLGAR